MELFVHFGINGADPACLTSHTYDAMMPYVCVHPLAIVFGTAPYDKEITTMPNTWLFSQLWLGSHLPDSLVHRQGPQPAPARCVAMQASDLLACAPGNFASRNFHPFLR